jgi:hypothetical protein
MEDRPAPLAAIGAIGHARGSLVAIRTLQLAQALRDSIWAAVDPANINLTIRYLS